VAPLWCHPERSEIWSHYFGQGNICFDCEIPPSVGMTSGYADQGGARATATRYAVEDIAARHPYLRFDDSVVDHFHRKILKFCDLIGRKQGADTFSQVSALDREIGFGANS
jgi:hypothetical protein